MNATWWRRNRFWLALLVPLLFLAVVASSFRLVNIYLPWDWTRPIVAHDTSGTLRQDFLGFDDVRREREVRVQVLSAVPQQVHGDAKAAAGAVLWRILLEFEAAPDQFLDSCTIELQDAEGTRYGHEGGMESVDGSGTPWEARLAQRCVPESAPGPTLEPFTGKLVPSPVERSRTWRLEYLIATPEAVEPTALRVGWHYPEYLVLEVP
ncbi:hypothetical protein J4N02_10655 [Propioniciclava sp. MC1595]|uniref:hypothetical protein n=1 Tax=unclassified Propioniciclava TaxID=2642922 RepID=UPI0016020EBD|nr:MULTISPECIES: hypothetical protein [unclassified Propioniciclava]MBB1493786.1 hypothetical protein [Propioniciclava sp. MC1595]MBB1500992.1 hypothetical protein [Propioniciclava sp. MC1683]QTE25014.1 hypothetical protein J4N02_10655 [Propioniciclava sp. MC1595]